GAQLRADAIAIMAALAGERLWLEKIRIQTHAPLRRDSAVDADDLATLLAEAAADPEFHEDLRQGLQPLLDRAPYELAGQVASFDDLKHGRLGELLDDAAAAVLDRLQ